MSMSARGLLTRRSRNSILLNGDGKQAWAAEESVKVPQCRPTVAEAPKYHGIYGWDEDGQLLSPDHAAFLAYHSKPRLRSGASDTRVWLMRDRRAKLRYEALPLSCLRPDASRLNTCTKYMKLTKIHFFYRTANYLLPNSAFCVS